MLYFIMGNLWSLFYVRKQYILSFRLLPFRINSETKLAVIDTISRLCANKNDYNMVYDMI